MARLFSQSVGGFYQTPPRLVGPIARLIRRDPTVPCAVLDPCAGEGAALEAFARVLVPEVPEKLTNRSFLLYAIEMEAGRAKKCEERGSQYPYRSFETLHSDAFRVSLEATSTYCGVSALYLNPPYDIDKEHFRTEEKFLRRFGSALMPNGILVFIVPGYTLKWSADTIARQYDHVTCFRFPEPEWNDYKQVVLYARRREFLSETPDPELAEKIQSWAANPAILPVLDGTESPLYEIPRPPTHTTHSWKSSGAEQEPDDIGFSTFTARPVDTITLSEQFRPWSFSNKVGETEVLPGILPDTPLDELLSRHYPCAMPPKAPHIAAGIASGVFNGEKVVPDDPNSGAPPLLVKGVFHREYVDGEEKTNSDGDVTGMIQVQHPRLVVSVFDLITRQYHTIKPVVETTGTTDPSEMTTGDLLTLYGKSLLKILLDHCPVMHDPSLSEHQIPLAPMARPLYPAQAQATMAAIKLLGGLGVPMRKRRGKNATILGEIGVGKTSVAIATMATLGVKRGLVWCPPHLLESWKEQFSIVYPEATLMVLEDVKDVERFANAKHPGMLVGILSRETAKLGHGVEGVSKSCPKCGGPVPNEDLAKKRSVCTNTHIRPGNAAAHILTELSLACLATHPDNGVIHHVLHTPHLRRTLKSFRFRKEALPENKQRHLEASVIGSPKVDALAWKMLGEIGEHEGYNNAYKAAFKYLLAVCSPQTVADILVSLSVGASLDPSEYGEGSYLRTMTRELLFLLPPGSDLQIQTAENLKALDTSKYRNWDDVQLKIKRLSAGESHSSDHTYYEYGVTTDGLPTMKGLVVRSPEMLKEALKTLHAASSFHRSMPCGERLYQAIPEPRRIPLATYITRRFPDSFEFLVIDEGHEGGNLESAQGRAAHRLIGIGHPTLLLSGSIMNGYAASLFANWWFMFPKFREEFGLDDIQRFIDRFGYRKILAQDVDRETGKVVEYGSQSDRVERTTKDIGMSPGVLPLFILTHLLPNAVTLQKSDLQLSLPPLREIPVPVTPTKELLDRHRKLLDVLKNQIQEDRRNPDLSGKLWGQMAEAPSHPDRATADVGNGENGSYEARYPHSVGNNLVVRIEPFPADTILPKEAKMLETLASELQEGRNVMVFGWHRELLPRLARLIESRFGIKVPILDPTKVSPAKRQEWINKNVILKRARVMVTNPVAIQTGLNNLVHFATEWWHENPACNPITLRQGIGRVDRIGQKLETRVYFAYYEGTAQPHTYSLLMHKVAVSASTDGHNPESALQAAGVGDSSTVTSFSVGRYLYKILESSGI